MTEYTDPFGRLTIIELPVAEHSHTIHLMIKKDRQAIVECWSLATALSIREGLNLAIKKLEELNENRQSKNS